MNKYINNIPSQKICIFRNLMRYIHRTAVFCDIGHFCYWCLCILCCEIACFCYFGFVCLFLIPTNCKKILTAIKNLERVEIKTNFHTEIWWLLIYVLTAVSKPCLLHNSTAAFDRWKHVIMVHWKLSVYITVPYQNLRQKETQSLRKKY